MHEHKLLLLQMPTFTHPHPHPLSVLINLVELAVRALGIVVTDRAREREKSADSLDHADLVHDSSRMCWRRGV